MHVLSIRAHKYKKQILNYLKVEILYKIYTTKRLQYSTFKNAQTIQKKKQHSPTLTIISYIFCYGHSSTLFVSQKNVEDLLVF